MAVRVIYFVWLCLSFFVGLLAGQSVHFASLFCTHGSAIHPPLSQLLCKFKCTLPSPLRPSLHSVYPFLSSVLFVHPPPTLIIPCITPLFLQPHWLFLSVVLLFRVWDVMAGNCKRTLKVQRCSDWCDSLALTPDGAHLVSGSNDGTIMWVIACVLAHQSKEESVVFVMW